ncbi:MAG: hypothetical protein FD147_2633 [Chloroflexi bacterium]|nr:MAG: hypothetical protein FD147_2633 [Chloroflexota bacterium]MBA4377033.1 hypothetical protein [Anaerolinea sp.]
MIVKAWNNGTHHNDGNGYGIKITSRDRDQYFDPSWKTIILDLDGENALVEVNINKTSFWTEACRELISKEIGKWLIKNKLAPWPVGKPPVLEMVQMGERHFRLTKKG